MQGNEHPRELLAAFVVTATVDAQWASYRSLTPPFLLFIRLTPHYCTRFSPSLALWLSIFKFYLLIH